MTMQQCLIEVSNVVCVCVYICISYNTPLSALAGIRA